MRLQLVYCYACRRGWSGGGYTTLYDEHWQLDQYMEIQKQYFLNPLLVGQGEGQSGGEDQVEVTEQEKYDCVVEEYCK